MGVSAWNDMGTIGPKLAFDRAVAMLGVGRGLRAVDVAEIAVAAATRPKTLSAIACNPDGLVQFRVR